jgi:O-antigen/teichoic acid export membrane protein
MSSFVKDTFSVGFSKIVIILCGLIRNVIIARWLGPTNSGIIAALAVYPSLFMTVGSLGIRQSTTFFIGKKIFSEQDIKIAIFQFWLISSLFSLLSSYFLIKYVSNSGGNTSYILLAILPIPFELFNTYNSGIFLGNNKISFFNRINWIPSVVILLFLIIFVIIFRMQIYGVLIATSLGSIIMFIVLVFVNKFISAFKFSVSWKIIESLFSLGIVYAISLLVISFNYKINVILLDKFSNSYQLGIYSKGAAITEYLWEIPMIFSTIIFARSAIARDGKEFSRNVIKLLRISIVVIGIASLFLVFMSRPIILLMYGSEFVESISVLKFLIPGVFLMTIYKILNMDLAGKGKPWVALQAMIPGLVINLFLNYFLIPKYGADGAAISSTFSYSFAALIFLYRYSVEVKIPIREILMFSSSDYRIIKSYLLQLLNKKK